MYNNILKITLKFQKNLKYLILYLFYKLKKLLNL